VHGVVGLVLAVPLYSHPRESSGHSTNSCYMYTSLEAPVHTSQRWCSQLWGLHKFIFLLTSHHKSSCTGCRACP